MNLLYNLVCNIKSIYFKRLVNFGGCRKNESTSGITCDSKILVRKKITIGADFICAWNVFVTYCAWHNYNKKTSNENVSIGNHGWIAHGLSILKGALIPDGCVVACHTIVSKNYTLRNSLIAGMNGDSKKNNIILSRGMIS